MINASEGDKIVITGPGEYCRADGVKVRITHSNHLGKWYGGGWWHDANGCVCGLHHKTAIISTWADRPDEFRKPKPAYRKDGTSRWPVGTKAVLVGGEYERNWAVGETITVTENGPKWDHAGVLVSKEPKGHRPLFRKLPEPAPLEPTEAHGGNPRDMRPEDKAFFGLDGMQTLVFYGTPGGIWGLRKMAHSDDHRLTLHIDTVGNVTGKMEVV
jgi:hypothetical protein